MSALQGKHVLLTRTEAQNQALVPLVRDYGAIPVSFPCLRITYCEENIQQAMRHIKPNLNTDIVFSSRNGVLAWAAASMDSIDTLKACRMVAVGQKTANALHELGLKAEIIPELSSQQGLIQAYRQASLPKQVYFFRAEQGSDDLLNFLQTQGVKTQLIHAYQSTCNTATLKPELAKQVDAVLLGSAKTAACFAQNIKHTPLRESVIIATMSQQVTKAADKLGLKVQITATEPSFKAMLDGLNNHFTRHNKG